MEKRAVVCHNRDNKIGQTLSQTNTEYKLNKTDYDMTKQYLTWNENKYF